MESACLRHTDIPHTSRLYTDFQYHFERVNRFYTYAPNNPESYRAAAAAIHYPDERRNRMVAALRNRNAGSPLLDRLAQPGTVAVVTGQQVGLFSGPSYTVYKALTAIRIAEQLNADGMPAVPVFWLATEDHDLAEVNHAFVFDAEHRPVTLRVNDAGPNQRPVGLIPIVEPPLEELRAALSSFPFGDQAVAMAEQAYRPGTSFGAAFQDLLKQLLSGHEILFLDPLDGPIRQLAAPILRDAVLASSGLTKK